MNQSFDDDAAAARRSSKFRRMIRHVISRIISVVSVGPEVRSCEVLVRRHLTNHKVGKFFCSHVGD